MDKAAAANSTYKKLAVQWLNLPAGRQVKLYSFLFIFLRYS